MQFKKNKAILAAVLAAATVSTAMMSATASAFEPRSKAEAYGDSTYAERFMSLYDDVINKGQENGYLSDKNVAEGGFGIPYHSVEELICEAPDYGHETTSEAMSYIVWIAAMHDNIVDDKVVDGADKEGMHLEKAWKTLEALIPKADQQKGFWGASLSAQVAAEHPDSVKKYPSEGNQENVGKNPLHSKLTSAYSEGREYLLHWLADVDDWYGFSGSARGTKGTFTFINTFQRGDQESCFETIPHPSIETLEYGNSTQGMKFAFQETTAKSWSYTNAPDAEDRAIQAVYAANRWNVGNDSVTTKAAMMGDMCRNDMYDKYYKAIGCQSFTADKDGGGENGKHYLMSWYTAWGGAADGSWAWQIGCSHAHQFYQNPLAAYGLLTDPGLSKGMLASEAQKDYEKSLERQLELYLWLSSAQGPFAGGCTNSWMGDYETYPSGIPTFHDMAYIEQPVYADPGSNNWTGNQYWATQRLAELYYLVKTDPTTAAKLSGITPGGMSIEEALKTVLDKWVAFFLDNDNTKLTDDGDFSIPSSLKWSGKPNNWSGSYQENSGLTCSVAGTQNTDLGCVSSFANTLIYYAKANGIEATGHVEDSSELAAHGLYVAQQLLDREWKIARDNIGLTRIDHNGSLGRFWSQEVYIPVGKSGKYPYGEKEVTNGATFIDLRPQYEDVPGYDELHEAYLADVAAGHGIVEFDADKQTYNYGMDCATTNDYTNVEKVDLEYHRFWHAGDILMALGTMYELYPDVTPTDSEVQQDDADWGNANCSTGSTPVERVTLDDAVLVAKAMAGKSQLSVQGKLNADVVNDGIVDDSDLNKILQFLSGKITYKQLCPTT